MSNININTVPRPSPNANGNPNQNPNRSVDSEEEEEGDGRMSDSGSNTASSQRSRTSSSSSSDSSSGSLEEDPDGEDEDMSEQDAASGSETEDDTTTCQSDELELAQLSGRDIFRLPRGLCENAAIFHEFFSMETWQQLPHHFQARLQPMLPDFTGLVTGQAQTCAEQQRTLVQLFNGGLERFGHSPLLQLQRQLEEGNLRPDVLQLRRSIQHSNRREFRFQQAERFSQLAKDLFLSRDHLLQHAYYSAPPSEGAFGKYLPKPRPRKRKPPTLSMENRFCTQRAKKRYAQDLLDILRELEVKPGDISADEEEEDEECSQLIDRLFKTPQDFKLEEPKAPEPVGPGRPSNAADKKCIYNTFFKRRPGVDDDNVLRTMQMERIPQLNDKNFRKYLRDYKRRKLEQPESPEFDTSEVRLRDICTRAQFVGSFKPGRKPKALMARLNPDPPALVPIGITATKSEIVDEEPMLLDEPQQLYGRRVLDDHPEEHLSPKEPQLMPKKVIPSPVVLPHPVPKLEPLNGPIASAKASPSSSNPPINTVTNASPTAGHITGSPTREVLIRPPATPRPVSFFSLLRDLFVSTPQHRLTYGELQILLASWREINSDASIPTGEWPRFVPDWSKLLQSAINFLSGDSDTVPTDYVPYIEHKTQLGIYQWIGAGRDSDARLLSLCQCWLRTQREEQSQLSPGLNSTAHLNALMDATPTPPPRCPTTWTVRSASQAEILEFQRQERIRFEYPHRPFTYRLNGYESVVGPVKGIYTQSLPLNKARGHAVMVDDRPPFVTILTLVRDATARLPNGEGTRSEISELLKCSQYISQQAADNVLQTIVSGALDRMHGGQDPCVKYDARRKIWIYLHRNRGEAEFEKMHRQNQSLVKQKQQQRKQLNRPKIPDGAESSGLLGEHQQEQLPALVPTVVSPIPVPVQLPVGASLQVKKPLTVKCPPVPPLKYHVPPGTPTGGTIVTASSNITANQSPLQQIQKSLLKPVGTANPASSPVQRQLTTSKTGNFAISKISPTRNTTPILVSTPTGLQTVHVATTPTQGATSGSPTVAKKLTIKKTVPSNKIGNFIIPLEQQQTVQQQQGQHVKVHPIAGKPKALTITPRPQMPKNIIRLLPAGGATVSANSAISTKPNSVQILGPRVVPQSQTVRPVQQKIGAVSIVTNKPVTSISGTETANPATASTSSPVTGGGTIVKMSPQAFANLQQQQQQLKQKMNSANPALNSPQQRIIVGNTAISANKKIVFQSLAKAAPKILTTSPSGTVAKATTNLSPQQQRILLQNFKQPVVATNQSGTLTALGGNATRVIRATPASGVVGVGNSQTPGQIITLDSLIQKQPAGGKLLTTAGNNIFQLATSSAGNVITLNSNQPTKQLPTMARFVSATSTSPATGNASTVVPKIIGKTTVLPGKPLLLHAKTLKQLGGSSVATTQTTTTTTTAVASATVGGAGGTVVSGSGVANTAVRTTQNIVIGGQTVKIQGAIPARGTNAPMQTVIMGNQLLRLATSSTNSGTTSTSGIATTPKTLLIGAGGTQTLRLAKNVLVANKQITSTANSSNVTSSTTATPASTATTTPGNNLVFAVQGNGGQLFFSPGLQGMNLKPLSSLKVIPMGTASATGGAAGGKISVTTVTGEPGAKALTTKLIPATVLKTATGSGN
ncbi:nuclear factor related to kappa-B-binding protein isoform X1 [Drosophila eugracilis]|uniref:nuclear factor related to kappa-B-binding protein isoform X1 n=1 Tax=Drosophila eugracilis TaxID=29029 RepID=UPI001BD92A5E|nr:nuclear factor related to kappa-B-binding protein isoform X1 [Drosophila eugracilis]